MNENFVFANITEDIIIKSTSDFKSKSSSGPDCLSAKLLKEIILDIAKPLSQMFNLSFKTGFIPVELKQLRLNQSLNQVTYLPIIDQYHYYQPLANY